jgi:hypothetical protein
MERSGYACASKPRIPHTAMGHIMVLKIEGKISFLPAPGQPDVAIICLTPRK